MSKTIYFDWDGYGHYADTVHENDMPKYSDLLGPDGQRLQYQKPKLGFDLSCKNNEPQK